MSRFLKLQKFVINKNNISYIEKTTDKFYIVLNKAPFIDGFMLMGSGGIGSSNIYIKVDNDDGKNTDYEIVKKWIDEQ